MQAIGRQFQRAPDGAPLDYERHRPEQTTLYRLVQQHAASLIALTEARVGSELPRRIKLDGIKQAQKHTARWPTPTSRSTSCHPRTLLPA